MPAQHITMEGQSQVTKVPSAKEYFNLGTYRRSISTTSQEAHNWFNRGLIWSYAFNHDEAALCFEQAITHDPECAMAYWGLAYVLGPNYNKPWSFFDDKERAVNVSRASEALLKGTKLAQKASQVEQALIKALQYRYPEQDDQVKGGFEEWNKSYCDAMEKVHAEFTDDLDVAALHADALMNVTPWDLWDIRTGKPKAGAHTLEAEAVLEKALALENATQHPGILHLYVHFIEMSPTPERGLPCANFLRNLVPDAGHLQHMPSHIDMLCGDYQSAITSNTSAIIADQKFVKSRGAVNFYTLYRAHDLHFRTWAAMYAAQSKIAVETAELLKVAIPEDLLRVESPPMADWLESFLSVNVHVFVRFGLWEDILALTLPKDAELYSTTTAMYLYAKGVAFASLGKIPEAEEQQKLFAAAHRKVPESRTLFNKRCIDILDVAAAMLDGELRYRRGVLAGGEGKEEIETAFLKLKEAVKLEDGLPYDEPWGWMVPARHALGALLLEQQRVEEARVVFEDDLGIGARLPRAMQHPGNVWGLVGLKQCLDRLGRKEDVGLLNELEVKLRAARAGADCEVKVSCFCSIGTDCC